MDSHAPKESNLESSLKSIDYELLCDEQKTSFERDHINEEQQCGSKNSSEHKKKPSLQLCKKPSKLKSYIKKDSFQIMGIPLIFSADVLIASRMKLLPDMTPDQSLDANVSIGLRDFTGEQYKSSLKRLNKAILQHPYDLTPRFVRGLCYEKLCKYELALKDFVVCCQLGMQDDNRYACALSYYNRGVICACLQKFDDAMDHFTAAISLYDLDPDFYSNRALLYRRSGDFQNAQSDYQSMRRLTYVERSQTNHSRRNRSIFNTLTPTKKTPAPDPDVKSSFYGKVHTALICPANDRSADQLEILVKETKMMTAFVHFDIDQLRTLWKYLEYQKYATNVRIFEQGDPADDYFVIWTGCVSARIQKENSNIRHANVARAFALEKEFIVNTMKAGQTLGEAVIDGGKRKAACVTEEPTELLILRKIHFDLTFKVFLERVHSEKVEFLSRLQCFKSFDRTKLDKMANFVREHVFNAGDTIIRQNDPADSIYFIKSGLISLLRTPVVEDDENIEQICLTQLCSGDIFGEAAALNNNGLGISGLFPSSAICETKTTCYRLDKNQMDLCGWDYNTRSLLTIMSVKYPDDSILVQAWLDRKRRKKIRKKMQKELGKR